jgi:hypothetical protein
MVIGTLPGWLANGLPSGRGMEPHEQIDIAFDFRSDTPTGKDPDAHSPTLRKYHRRLWSKPLPSGVVFELNARHVYLHHRSKVGEFFLSSDTVIPTFSRERRISHIINQTPTEEQDAFNAIGYTIGGMMLFPGNRIGGKMTINGARGFHPKIKDRFDLTVECIRRHYRDEHSPLSDTLARYAGFFGLFGNFQGYVEHFLLQDLVTVDCSAVRFFMPFADFTTSPLPETVEVFRAYRELAIDFIKARNHRILQSC